jgi:Domain of unknown function (DUF222)
MDTGQAWSVGVADLEEPDLWEDDELTPEELARLYALEDDPVGAPAPVASPEPAAPDGEVPDLLAAVLAASGDPAGMSDAELIRSLAAWHALAARAQGRELRATAELLRRRRPRVWDRRADRAETRREGLDGAVAGEADSPERVIPAVVPSREATEEIALALTVTDYAAGVQAQLAADLTGRLPAAFAELEAGRADLTRVRVLAEATQFLSDEDAGKVDALLSPELGQMTTGTLKDKARRAVIKIDPAAAERRKAQAERRARFALYGNDDQTATVAVEKMPAQLAAAAKARVSAIARAAKAAGMAGPLALLEAKVATGLLLDTLPLIPPPAGGPDCDGPDCDGPAGEGPAGEDPGGPGSGPDNPGPAGSGWDDGWPAGPSESPADNAGETGPDDLTPGDEAPSQAPPEPADWPGPEDPDLADTGPAAFEPPAEPNFGPGFEPDPDEDEPHASGAGPDGDRRTAQATLPWPRIPVRAGAAGPGCAGLPAWLRPKTPGRVRLGVPWRTLAGIGPEPGDLSWIGPVTPAQARELAAAAATDPSVAWRLIVTDDDGHAITVTTLRGGTRPGDWAPGLISEVTITIQQSLAAALDFDAVNFAEANRTEPDFGKLAELLARAIPAANQAAAEAAARTGLDEQAGGCAHTMAAAGYRVPETLRRWLNARDRTCRNPICRQPAARCDQDHTTAYQRGGRTCTCNLGGLCRVHHQLKQLPGWHLSQDAQGNFTWTTPAGLTYRKEPHRYPV